jgi:hypothetical protein
LLSQKKDGIQKNRHRRPRVSPAGVSEDEHRKRMAAETNREAYTGNRFSPCLQRANSPPRRATATCTATAGMLPDKLPSVIEACTADRFAR